MVAVILITAFLPGAVPGETVHERPGLPAEYGKIIYRHNGNSPYHLYIIAIGHRDTLTGSNNNQTPLIQAEIYKIAEWLIRNRQVNLLLPEGFFEEPGRNRAKAPDKGPQAKEDHPSSAGLDIGTLEGAFSGNSGPLNAEMLLRANYLSLRMKQIEDKGLYRSVHGRIQQLAGRKRNLEEGYLVKSELDYYQDRRVGAMLQRIPGIIEREFREDHIPTRRALFTIGLSHIPSIIRYLDKKEICVFSPLFSREKCSDIVDELNLAKKDFSISVILPKTLADNSLLGTKIGL